MKYLFDTDHITILQRRQSAEYLRLTQRMAQHAAHDFAYSIVSFHEQALGASSLINKARTTARVVHAYGLLDSVRKDYQGQTVLPFDSAAGATYDSLRTLRIRIGTMDLRIASVALARDLILLTRNMRNFAQVPGLKIEDWTV